MTRTFRLLPALLMVAAISVMALLSACGNNRVAEFWRPISEPNIMLPLDKAQRKLEFDLSQCNCGIFPTNIPQHELIEFQPDKQRMVETGVTAAEEKGQCMQKPSLIVAECMRTRGWEVTQCSGRMPVAGGGAVCAAYVF
ncbi:MAG: hypothetical protein GC131_03880 [Alphaproteobacteria bacterium]|nr:hypothetical protein [Alphaproteobacteria bacterium]